MSISAVVMLSIGSLLIYSGATYGAVGLLLARTRFESIGSVDSGLVKLRGTIARTVGGRVTGPVTETEATVIGWSVEEYDGRLGANSRWVEQAAGVNVTPFVLSDESGDVAVDLNGSTEPVSAVSETDRRPFSTTTDEVQCFITESDRVEVGVDETPPARLAGFIAGIDGVGAQSGSPLGFGGGPDHGDRRYIEGRIGVGEEICVLGEYDSDTELLTIPEDVPAVLSNKPQWKLVGWRTLVASLQLLFGGVLVLVGVLSLYAVVATVLP